MLDWIKDRVGEPSSWAGIAALFMGVDATGIAAELDAEFWTSLGIVVAGLIAVFKRGRAEKQLPRK